MKRFLKFIIISVIIVISAFTVFELSKQYNMNLLKNNISWSIVAKNCKNAVAFDKDSDGNTYIAYDNNIKLLRGDGRQEEVFQDDSLNIEKMIYCNGKLYFISYDKLYQYDIENKKEDVLLKSIPYEGKYMDRNIIMKDGKLLLSIGTATNSGIAYNENTCDMKKIPYDNSPINLTLKGINHGKDNTGAFMPYGNSSYNGQKVKAVEIGNASIIEINLKNKEVSLFACGIRNIKGWDIDSNGNLIGIVGGMENTGLRPVNRDFDYIYQFDKGKWYGWPDFSGGDPIDSPRFKNEKVIEPLIENPPNKIVSAPIYQFSTLNSMVYMSIDKEGKILETDMKVFYDKVENTVCAMNSKFVKYNLLKLKEESRVNDIKYCDGNIYILDSGIGCIYKLQKAEGNFGFNLPLSVWIFIIILLTILLFVILNKSRVIKIKSK